MRKPNRTRYQVTCAQCGQPAWRPRNELNRAERDGSKIFCGRSCAHLAKRIPGSRPTVRRYIRNNVPHAFTLAERLAFYSIPEPNSGCWLWTGHVSGNGYGKIRCKNVNYATHRAAYECACGPVPEGLFVCHRCDVRSCVNPAHLFLGTHEDNMADRNTKGRHAHGASHPASLIDVPTAVSIFFALGEQRAIARQFGTNQATVWQIKNRKHWTMRSSEGAKALAELEGEKIGGQGVLR